MKIDLRYDFTEILEFVAQRISGFDAATNVGPGKPGPISQIDFGFQCDQAGWVCLVFDTRPDATSDGERTGYIEENNFPRSHWKMFSEDYEYIPMSIVKMDGTTLNIRPDDDYDQLSELLGELLKSVLFKAREMGLFVSLPRAAECHIAMEEFGRTHFGWPPFELRALDDLV